MSRIADVLRNKGADVVTVRPDAPVADLISLLVGRNIGAAVVTEGDAMVGIVSERDVVHHIHDRGDQLLSTPVSEIMTSAVVSCGPDDEVDALMRTMTDRRIRHVPVLVNGSLVGIVSIGDMVKARIRELEEERAYLHQYLAAGS